MKCCAIDPERHERLRLQARKGSRRNVLPMTRQLALGLQGSSDEEQLDILCAGREDVPAGLRRLVG